MPNNSCHLITIQFDNRIVHLNFPMIISIFKKKLDYINLHKLQKQIPAMLWMINFTILAAKINNTGGIIIYYNFPFPTECIYLPSLLLHLYRVSQNVYTFPKLRR